MLTHFGGATRLERPSSRLRGAPSELLQQPDDRRRRGAGSKASLTLEPEHASFSPMRVTCFHVPAFPAKQRTP